jgi:ribose transport system permease protein
MDALTEDKNQGLVERFFIFWDKIGILLVFIVVCVIFGILNPVFFNPLNIINVIRQVSIIGVMAVGMTLVILLGLIDLSVGSIVAFAEVAELGRRAGFRFQ